MQNGICPKCSSSEVYYRDYRFTYRVIVSHLFGVASYPRIYICATCGYMEEYIQNPKFWEAIKKHWKKG